MTTTSPTSSPPDDKLAYRCITGKDDHAFCERVSQALADGWVLHGSPSITFNPEAGYCVVAQAVIWAGSIK